MRAIILDNQVSFYINNNIPITHSSTTSTLYFD